MRKMRRGCVSRESEEGRRLGGCKFNMSIKKAAMGVKFFRADKRLLSG